MLNGIKSMIQEKTNFLEAASIIFEDGSGMNLDDQIILGESDNLPTEDGDIALGEDGTDDHNEPEVNDVNEPDNKDENNQGEGNNKDEVPSNDNDTPIEDMEIDNDKPQDVPKNEPYNASDDLLDSNIEDEPIEGGGSESDSVNGGLPGEDLPEPIGAQTGEPINLDDDILNVEVDLGSNTVKDVLPVPPAGASDMVPTEDGENPTQHVDSGFGGNKEIQESEEKSVEPSYVENYFSSIGLGNTSFQEAITLADNTGGDEGKSDESGSNSDTSIDTSGLGDTPMDEPAAEESPVTSAVKDKVAESDEENDISVDGGSEAKLEILKKLGNITKNIEDAKKAVMNSIQ